MSEPDQDPQVSPPERSAEIEKPHVRMRRPWRWVLGAVSIAALGAGVFFISKKGVDGRPKPGSIDD